MGCASSRATVERTGDDTVAGQYEDGTVGQIPQASDDTAQPAPCKRHLAQRARRGSVRLCSADPLLGTQVPSIFCRCALYDINIMQVSAEVKSFSATRVETLNLRKSLQTEDNLIGALRHCFLFQGRNLCLMTDTQHAQALISLVTAAIECGV